MEEIRVTIGHAAGEISEKKSRFIANVFEIHSENEAIQYLEAIRKQYYDARHNCYAYVLGQHSETQRFSDDKEPQGTAGKPILDIIRNQGYHNTLIVVTRYFGGILLGTGGLVRAYSAAAQEGLNQAELSGSTSIIYSGQRIDIRCDYSLLGKIQYIISQMDIPLEETVYEDKVLFRLIVRDELCGSFIKKITEATNAASEIISGDHVAYAVSDGHPVIYNL